MTPREVHIAIDLGLQKLGSFAYDNIKPEYIDYTFNRMGDQYILEKTSRRFDPKQSGLEDNITRLSSIRELMTEVDLTVYNSNTKRQYSLLPYNYFSFVEAVGNVLYDCHLNNVTPVSTNVTEYMAILPFKESNFGTPTATPFSATKIYKVINTTPVEIFDFSDYSTGLTDISEIFTVKNKVLDEINKISNLKVYWEVYREFYYPDSFIFISTDAAFDTQGMKIEYTAVLNDSDSFTNTVYTNSLTTNPEVDNITPACRLVSNEEIGHLRDHPFGKPKPQSPIITVSGNFINIHKDERFILKGLNLKYIRKPRRMNLPLNQSYEIQDQRALEKIIDSTVQYLAATIESQGYQALAIENQQRD